MIIDTTLTQKHCVPCEGGMPPLDHEYVQKYAAQVPDWKVSSSVTVPTASSEMRQSDETYWQVR